jgi:hypothetical protein
MNVANRDSMLADWSAMCDQLRAFGHAALQEADSLDRAEGLRHALRFLAHLADQHIEFADPARPEFRSITSATRKFYGDGTDVDYLSACIDPAHAYRITGTRGSTPHLSIIVYRSGLADRIAGNLVDTEFVRPDGGFEITLATEPFTGPGIVLDARCNEVVVRQYHKDRGSERSATVRIERIGDPAPPRAPLDPAWMGRAIERCTKGLGLSLRRLDAIRDALAARPNRLEDADSVGLMGAFYGTSANRYAIGWFDLDPDSGDALEFRLPRVGAKYVGVQLFNRWFESLEFRDHVTSLNDAQLRRDADGWATVTIGGEPGTANRIDPCGHRQGLMLVRFLELDAGAVPPALDCRVVRQR